jgi:hypothetical protein
MVYLDRNTASFGEPADPRKHLHSDRLTGPFVMLERSGSSNPSWVVASTVISMGGVT